MIVLTAEQMLDLPIGTGHDDMIVSNRSWSRKASEAALAAAKDGTPYKEYEELLGRPAEIVLTGDAGPYFQGGWCLCESGTAYTDGGWIRFERWTGKGREAHGFIHDKCRKLLQAG